MRSDATSALLLPLLLSLPAAAAAAKPPKNAILLSQVKTLTLRGDGAQTTHRRLPAVPQLKCLSAPKLCALHPIDVLRCTNQGSGYDAEDVQWSCAANLPVDLKLGSTDVVCEGYSSADDPYVLKGSCGVEYRVPSSSNQQGQGWRPGFWSGLAGGAAAGYMAGGRNNNNNNNNNNRNDRRTGFGGGGYGYGTNDGYGWGAGPSRTSSGSSSSARHESTGFGSTNRR
ncbi:Serine/threonine-protein kinase SRPK3 [Verticillium dahliae VDG2]|nr:Serine/threonine-protein kinase SRPK3 [Verticillium dahliae VDG2]